MSPARKDTGMCAVPSNLAGSTAGGLWHNGLNAGGPYSLMAAQIDSTSRPDHPNRTFPPEARRTGGDPRRGPVCEQRRHRGGNRQTHRPLPERPVHRRRALDIPCHRLGRHQPAGRAGGIRCAVGPGAPASGPLRVLRLAPACRGRPRALSSRRGEDGVRLARALRPGAVHRAGTLQPAQQGSLAGGQRAGFRLSPGAGPERPATPR